MSYKPNNVDEDKYISKLDKPNGNQYIYTIHRAIVYRALEVKIIN